MTSDELAISVGLATRAADDLASRAIESVARQLGARDELILVFTGEHERDAEPLRTWLHESCPGGRLLVRPQTGISEARNAVLDEARSPIVCFIDDDETAEPGWLDAYRRVWSEAPAEVAVIGGPMLGGWDAGRPPWLRDHLLHIVSVLDLGDERLVLDQAPGTGFAWGGNMSVRRSTALEVGGFDPQLGLRPGAPFDRGEDEELQKRLVAAGAQVWYEPGARIVHHVRPERLSITYFSRMVRWDARGDAERPFALLHGFRRLARSGGRYVLGLMRRDQAEREVAMLGLKHGVALVRARLGRAT